LSRQEQDKNLYYSLYGIWTIVKQKLAEKTGERIKYERFSRIVRTYLDVVLERVIYKNQPVDLYSRMGTLFGTKILCTKFNPYKNHFHKENGKKVLKKVSVNIMKDDGYFFFIAWKYPRWFNMYRFKAAIKWRRFIYKNVVDGSDYPELCP